MKQDKPKHSALTFFLRLTGLHRDMYESIRDEWPVVEVIDPRIEIESAVTERMKEILAERYPDLDKIRILLPITSKADCDRALRTILGGGVKADKMDVIADGRMEGISIYTHFFQISS
jgi:hypothetical protein